MKLLTEKQRSHMMTQGIRDLFVAGWLGEQVFAQLGLHRAVNVLDDPRQRTKVIGASWKAERPFGAPLLLGLVGASLANLVREEGRENVLDVIASGCALGAVGASIGCAVAGRMISHVEPGDNPIETGFTPDEETPQRARSAQHALRLLAPAGMLLGLASIGLSIAARRYE